MTILIAGGGTGGHLFPGIALAEEIRRRHPTARLVFVGTARGLEARVVPKAGFELRLLAVRGLRNLGLRRQLGSLLRLPYSMAQAMLLVRRLRPQLAVSVGGYAAGPAMLAAHLQGVRCVVLEQNSTAGLTTRLLSRFAARIVAGLPCPELPAARTLVLGNPVRQELVAVRDIPYAPQQPLRLLVLGGSQGARVLNDALLAMLPELQKSGLRAAITHQTGVADAPRVAAAYAKVKAPNLQLQATAFIDQMAAAYENHDLVLGRAGATTVAELLVCGRPSILVPFAAAAGNHQWHNAQLLVRAGAARCLSEAQLKPAAVLHQLQELSADPARLQRMAAAARAMGRPQALQDIADVVLREVARV
jgi:UDP-N-acetylglucosamine--N-acetylmuramyl-(pentapeptide) pyrophosphoryl-undecaprenol N-acetylglucosamine transferase